MSLTQKLFQPFKEYGSFEFSLRQNLIIRFKSLNHLSFRIN